MVLDDHWQVERAAHGRHILIRDRDKLAHVE